jgi:isopentenyl diphosphate isomerase/L-lactate dehydrogenase-like FMN-dependent dehydrogenase
VDLGWRTHDIDTAFFPFAHGYGTQIASSDPVFAARYGFKPILKNNLEWPYRAEVQEKKIQEGDEEAKMLALIGAEFAKECLSNTKTWEDFRALKKRWGGPLILKGLQHFLVCL